MSVVIDSDDIAFMDVEKFRLILVKVETLVIELDIPDADEFITDDIVVAIAMPMKVEALKILSIFYLT